mmetsp:Transcript_13845/g.22964  ORF Transcript_13845/g.22964 Transcript_13845/m.22964 type:complete len:151 (-) Transcript_13845:354-806(-)
MDKCGGVRARQGSAGDGSGSTEEGGGGCDGSGEGGGHDEDRGCTAGAHGGNGEEGNGAAGDGGGGQGGNGSEGWESTGKEDGVGDLGRNDKGLEEGTDSGSGVVPIIAMPWVTALIVSCSWSIDCAYATNVALDTKDVIEADESKAAGSR